MEATKIFFKARALFNELETLLSTFPKEELRGLRFEGVPPVRAVADSPTRRAASAPSFLSKEDPSSTTHELLRSLLHRFNVDPEIYRAIPLERRLGACLRALRCHTVADARRVLDTDPERGQLALEAVLLGVTEFFRDGCVFEQLRELLREFRARDRGLRVWSASCSDGREIYSVAMIAAECGLLEKSVFLGTDLRAKAVLCAGEGFYDETALKALPATYLEKYVVACGPGYRINRRVLSRVRFERRDVTGPWPQERWDVVLWRNTAIYFRPVVAAAVWQRLAESVRPGGLLIVGKAERPECGVRLRRIGRCIYRRVEEK